MSIHTKNLQNLDTECLNVKNGLSLELMKETFVFQEIET